ncbi:SAM-dependent methyltransferase [Streptomyces sp. DSM 44917]|uniref:S-adenosyl-L-methionine-dependent methyltransferase n=1 Tax=Streptomyces boetiae TaxID=3075541 RepID=A0ABU2L2W8_9ACTN|nr:SAM-dependent methyltransferase [Streptomyces sp. DSM 44917]MDT0305916.1 SAM-dependent methyltransferase [Streptomyces sp. DSM 44917]
MSAAPLPEILSGPPLTAVGVAVVRAAETRRPDRLYADPLAQAFVDAAERAHLAPTAPPGAAETWAGVLALAEAMRATRTLGVRLADDGLLAAAEAGCTQAVLLGAGLDTHAFRLEWPVPVHVFEADLPQLFAFKEPVLAAQGAEPVCARSVVPVDLRAEDWPGALLDAGFRPELPTAWVDQVIATTLPRDEARRAVRRLTALSAPGSRYGYPVLPPGSFARTVRAVPGAERVFPVPEGDPGSRGLGAGDRAWLEGLGWSTAFREISDLTAGYGREVPASPGAGMVAAVRL